jgi:hypothetical protein
MGILCKKTALLRGTQIFVGSGTVRRESIFQDTTSIFGRKF